MTGRLKGACHCGAVTFDADPKDRFLVKCNCTICLKLGAVWLHSPPAEAVVHAPEGSTIAYIRDDRNLAFHSCKICGCTTHWSLIADPKQVAVNMQLADPNDTKTLPLRNFDGRETWEFLD